MKKLTIRITDDEYKYLKGVIDNTTDINNYTDAIRYAILLQKLYQERDN